MLHRFATYEEAALFVAHKRSEGYYAEVLHENVSTMWGPLPMGGVGVWVSEEAADEGEEIPEIMHGAFSLPTELSKLMGALTLGIVAAYFLWLILQGAFPYLIVLVVVLALEGLAFFLFASVLSVCLLPWLRAIRDPMHRHHDLAMAVMGAIAALLAVMVLLIL